MKVVILPRADTGDWSDGVTVTLMTLAEVPPPNDRVTVTTPAVSEPVKVGLENCTVSTAVNRMRNELKHVNSTVQIIVHLIVK